jgi:7-keto-8-aminopelargonate synthetase-like enzyme
LEQGDTVILDKLCHASLIDGARQSGATLRVYPHNNLDKLERLLGSAREKCAADARLLVVTESIFSMEGDRAPLREIVELTERHDALLLVDEAHAVGVLGETGQGLAQELGLQGRIALQMGTLGKAVGSAGGYLAADRRWIDLLLNSARSFIYSTAPPPAQAAASLRGLEIIASQRGATLRDRLWRNINNFGELSRQEPVSAIVSVMVGQNEPAVQAAEALLQAGFLAPAIRFPTVPRGTARLRITLSAAHETGQIEELHRELRKLAIVN